MLGRDEVQAPTSGVRRTKLAMRSSGHQSRDPSGQLLKTSFKRKTSSYREQTDYKVGHRRTCDRQRRSPAVLLCSKGGARGHYILLDDREDELEERKLDGKGLWTQALLARDELDGWSASVCSRGTRWKLRSRNRASLTCPHVSNFKSVYRSSAYVMPAETVFRAGNQCEEPAPILTQTQATSVRNKINGTSPHDANNSQYMAHHTET